MKTRDEILKEFLSQMKTQTVQKPFPKIVIPEEPMDITIEQDMTFTDYTRKRVPGMLPPKRSIFEHEFQTFPTISGDDWDRQKARDSLVEAQREAEMDMLRKMKEAAMKEVHDAEAARQIEERKIAEAIKTAKAREEAQRAENPDWGSW